MKYKIIPMKKADALDIVNWKYANEYSLYNLNGSMEAVAEFLNETYYSVFNASNELIGFFCYGDSAQVPFGVKLGIYDDSKYLDIGLGLKPEYCGIGLGKSFLESGLEFSKAEMKAVKLRLTVAAFNIRAIKLYKKVGFVKANSFYRKLDEGNVLEFWVMLYNQ